jgi:hypothetical protein
MAVKKWIECGKGKTKLNNIYTCSGEYGLALAPPQGTGSRIKLVESSSDVKPELYAACPDCPARRPTTPAI